MQQSTTDHLPWNFNLRYLCLFYAYIYIFKFLNNKFAPQLAVFVKEKTHEHNTRRRGNIYVQQSHSRLSDKTFNFILPQLWNKLPSHLQENTSDLVSFKRDLHSYLTSRATNI
jgi:hypothetical protein